MGTQGSSPFPLLSRLNSAILPGCHHCRECNLWDRDQLHWESPAADTSSSPVFAMWAWPLCPDSEGTQVQDCLQKVSMKTGTKQHRLLQLAVHTSTRHAPGWLSYSHFTLIWMLCLLTPLFLQRFRPWKYCLGTCCPRDVSASVSLLGDEGKDILIHPYSGGD